MKDPFKARNFQVFRDEFDRKTAVDCDEIAAVREVFRATELPYRRLRMWELTLRSGAVVCIEYDVRIEDLLTVLDIQ